MFGRALKTPLEVYPVLQRYRTRIFFKVSNSLIHARKFPQVLSFFEKIGLFLLYKECTLNSKYPQRKIT